MGATLAVRRRHGRHLACRPLTTRRRRYAEGVNSPEEPASVRPVEYKGEPLDSERGPGLGCFRFQLVVLAVAIVLTPLSVVWESSQNKRAGLLFLTIFLLRLVAADRREGRRRPLASPTPTVGELEDREGSPDDEAPASPDRADDEGSGPASVRE